MVRPLKVLIVRDRPSAGGGIINYYNAIRPHVSVDVVFSDVGRPHPFYRGDQSLLLRFNAVRLIWDWICLAFKIIRHRPDLVHVNPGMDPKTYRSLKRDAVNILVARLLRRPVLVFWRGWDSDYCDEPEFPSGNDSYLCRIYQLAAAHIVLARRFKRDLERWGFACPIHVETTVASDEVTAAGQERPHASGAPSVLYLSRIEAEKGVFVLIHAFAALKRQRSDITLTIAGDGPDLEAAKQLVRELRLQDVTFPGFVSGQDKVEQYRKASLFCFASSYGEGMPNAVLEAMAMGLPLVCSDAGGLEDILTDGVHGFVLKSDHTRADGHKFDPLSVAERIAAILGNERLYAKMSRANREFALERFEARQVARRLTSIYSAIPH